MSDDSERDHVDVTVVIPSLSFDGGLLTGKAVDSVDATAANIRTQIVVVDDASEDGSGIWLRQRYPHLIVLRNEKRSGFTIVNNRGLETATGRYLLMLNNDAELLPGCLQQMVDYLDSNEAVAIVGAKLLLTDEPNKLDSALTYLLPFGYIQYVGWRSEDDPLEVEPVPVFTVKGACALVRTELIRRYGFLVPDYHAYFEEAELCWRMWLLGYKCIYLTGARALHGLGKTNLRLPSPLLDYNMFKNRLATTLTHFELRTVLLALPMHALIAFGAIVFYVFRRRYSNAWAIVRSLWWNVLRFGATLHARAELQKKRVISDEELFKLVGTEFGPIGFIKHALLYGTRV